mmetsp:Transcript_98607/g.284496  ORF Transcript_98607/g.284496 Transcript_98607/m.284496 type:complete len:211 (+) Transcript_98607:163-795(+)
MYRITRSSNTSAGLSLVGQAQFDTGEGSSSSVASRWSSTSHLTCAVASPPASFAAGATPCNNASSTSLACRKSPAWYASNACSYKAILRRASCVMTPQTLYRMFTSEKLLLLLFIIPLASVVKVDVRMSAPVASVFHWRLKRKRDFTKLIVVLDLSVACSIDMRMRLLDSSTAFDAKVAISLPEMAFAMFVFAAVPLRFMQAWLSRPMTS